MAFRIHIVYDIYDQYLELAHKEITLSLFSRIAQSSTTGIALSSDSSNFVFHDSIRISNNSTQTMCLRQGGNFRFKTTASS